MNRKKRMTLLLGLLMGLIALAWLTPIYFVVINAFKDFREVVVSTAAFPQSLYLENFKELWIRADYPLLVRNSLIITVSSLAGIVLLGSMAGYKLARTKSRWSYVLLLYFIMTMIIPFQAIMIPLVKVLKEMNLIDSLGGIILVYIAQSTPIAIFFYQAAVRSIPESMEESARIDGAGPYRTFFSIIFPLLSPITATVVILQTLRIWNDFLLPLVTLQSPANKTLALGTYAVFVGKYGTRMNIGMAAVFLASIPMLTLYLVLQKYIVKGITSGATKG